MEQLRKFKNLTNTDRYHRGLRVNELSRRSWLHGKPYPELGQIIETFCGHYVVISCGYGGDGWVLTVPVERIMDS